MNFFRCYALAGAVAACVPAAGAAGQSAATASAAASEPVTSQPVTTAAAQSDVATLCPEGKGYPAQFDWNPNQTVPEPLSATMGKPKIEQYRKGVLVATYVSFANGPNCSEAGDGSDRINPASAAASGCGPFTRSHAYSLLEPGDSLIVYPAMYSGDINNAWIGALPNSDSDYQKGIFTPPVGVSVTGFVTDNVRPVLYLNTPAAYNTLNQAPLYISQSKGLIWSNVDVVSGPAATVGNSGVYIEGATSPTLSYMRVSGFGLNMNGDRGADGVLTADDVSGVLTMSHMELTGNGGSNGPSHNAYIAASSVDPNFQVVFSHSWSHNARYGHDFKSRAQRTTIVASYLEGGLPLPGQTVAESYNLDDPNGGVLIVKRTVLVKNMSGASSNGINLEYGAEGIIDSRPLRIDIENNIFVTFAKTYDGTHLIFPMQFFYPQKVPGTPGFPVASVTIADNAFVGYCPTGTAYSDYRGLLDVAAGFSELNENFSLAQSARFAPAVSNVIGSSTYGHITDAGSVRKLPTIGAMD